MRASISIPDEAVKYILLQRTSYLSSPTRALFRINPWVYKQAVALEAALRRSRVKRLFNEGIAAEYEEIEAWLPTSVGAVLDIGCGVGGIDVLLYRRYDSRPEIQFHMLDKTTTDKKLYYGFERQGAFYNSLAVTELVLFHNGIPKKNIHLLEATPDHRIPVPSGVDLVLSLLSWGFHYPVSVYMDQVRDILKPGGCLILDVRKGTGGEEVLKQTFAWVETISEHQRHVKVLALR